MTNPENHPALPGVQRASSFAIICLTLFLAVVGLTIAMMTWYPTPTEGGHELVAEFSGSGNGETGTVQVEDQWEFRWEHDGHLQEIHWNSTSGTSDMFMEMPGKPIRYHGGINYREGGEYRFRVVGEGNWTIRVYQYR